LTYPFTAHEFNNRLEAFYEERKNSKRCPY
jgi:hypothetical protein